MIAATPVDLVLHRLDGVRKAGRGWAARCPAHKDRSASLSVAIGNDDRVLIHCFAGCGAVDILAALDLTLADLFPARRDIRDMTHEERNAMRQVQRVAGWSAALAVLEREATVVQIAAGMVANNELLAVDDRARLIDAVIRIGDAREHFRGGQVVRFSDAMEVRRGR